jgi:hypothetical protein
VKLVELGRKIERIREMVEKGSKIVEIKESEKELEAKVEDSMRQVKVLGMDLGKQMETRTEIVGKVVEKLRKDVKQEDKRRMDYLLSRTRIVPLGSRTELRVEKGEKKHTVPILFDCECKGDREELNRTLAKMGLGTAFHWPKEMVDFIGGIREEVRKRRYGEGHFTRIRPERRNGQTLIRADVKMKDRGRFKSEAFWRIPPADPSFWPLLNNVYGALPDRKDKTG